MVSEATWTDIKPAATLYERVPCALCGSSRAEFLYPAHDVAYGEAGEFTWVQCVECGLIYLNPRPTREAIARYYPNDYLPYRPAIEEERLALMRWMRRRKLAKRRNLIERYSGQKRGRLLDVGCATGLFLHEMAQAGWQVAGVEPNASAAEYARHQFAVDVFQGTLGEAPYEPDSFDVVTFWDVLEHTFCPAEELAHAARLLRLGGLLVLSVPNWSSVDRWLFGCHWQGLDSPRHLYVFTRETLTALLAQAGFLVLDWVCFVSGYFSFVLSVERWLKTINSRLSTFVRRALDFPGMRFPFEPYFAISNWLGKGAIISVFARKTVPWEVENQEQRTRTTLLV